MYFFQDDIGLLIQHAQYNFWQWLVTPQAEHFAPLLHALTFFEFKLFNLNFYGYLFTGLMLHGFNIILLYKILRILKLDKWLAIIVVTLFTVNLTFIEPLLWFSAQGIILCNIFISLSFYYWRKSSPLTYVFLIASSFSYSTGLGLGIIFGIISLINGKFKPFFFLLGILSVLMGPIVAGSSLGQITPVIKNPLTDLFLFIAFVIGGVGRGVFSRLFLPGFEPRHFEIIKTLISFLPFAIVAAIATKILILGPRKIAKLILSLSILILYPYVWAGSIRFHFGIKQALSERYAYTPLFFSLILIGIILKYFFDKKIIRSYKALSFFVLIILFFQIINFHKKAIEFEKRPMLTKKYIENLQSKIKNKESIPDKPLPEFINQPLNVSDLYPILIP